MCRAKTGDQDDQWSSGHVSATDLQFVTKDGVYSNGECSARNGIFRPWMASIKEPAAARRLGGEAQEGTRDRTPIRKP